MKFILGRKVGMTRVFDEEGRALAVTKVAVLPTVVSQIKSKEKDGYKAVQVKALRGKDRVAKVTEFAVEAPGRYKVGESITPKQFKKDEVVTVTGTGKGKGFAGTIKRHGFRRGPAGHGSNNVREPGSIGGGYPQRVVLGRKMAGRMGGGTVTVKNLRIVDLDEEMILLSGAVPGPNKGVLKIFGKGEQAEETVDTAAAEEKQAMERMIEEQKAEKEAKPETKLDREELKKE
ncbi:MAG: 50S ribosomal protein L3 [Patescibacteria group bacterium]|mgnify:CR=1 FL=1